MAQCYEGEGGSRSLLSNWRNAVAAPILRDCRVPSVPIFDALKDFGGQHKGGDDWCASAALPRIPATHLLIASPCSLSYISLPVPSQMNQQ